MPASYISVLQRLQCLVF